MITTGSDRCFLRFNSSIEGYELPERFTFPFYHDPHPLCQLAAEELQKHLSTQTDWQHHFGIDGDKETAIGKMFGVLLVKNSEGEIGYLAGFSGKLADSNHLPNFVPPVFDMLTDNGFFKTGQAEIDAINHQIEALESSTAYIEAERSLQQTKQKLEAELEACRAENVDRRKQRKQQRQNIEHNLQGEAREQALNELNQQSIQDKRQLKDLKATFILETEGAEAPLKQFQGELETLKAKRKVLSASLQQQLFKQYRFLNQTGLEKSLGTIFQETIQQTTRRCGRMRDTQAGSICFQACYAAISDGRVLVGGFTEIRNTKASAVLSRLPGKVQPILTHMLDGIDMDENPFLLNPAEGKDIEIVYEDESMLVINKPHEFLSIPGKDIQDSVYERIRQRYPKATGPLVVHRLDMSTSGLMVIALNKEAHKKLQRQFIKRTVKKRYVALLDGMVEQDEGFIDLPLRVDLDDRPRQLVCYEYGKSARTQWKVIERREGQTLVNFYPITGRTHQLRVHAAHVSGLNTPIVGDDLYGQKLDRLYLHAEYLEIIHPVTDKIAWYQAEAPF